jgi:hypothetical protein
MQVAAVTAASCKNWTALPVVVVIDLYFQWPNNCRPMHDTILVCCSQVAAVTAESCDTVEDIANMGVAMKYAQPTQVRVISY